MVEEIDADDFGDFDEAAGEDEIVVARSGIAGRMVVCDHYAAGVPADRLPENFTDVHRFAVPGSAADENRLAKRMKTGVERQHPEIFLQFVRREHHPENIMRVRRLPDRPPPQFVRRKPQRTRPEFERRREFQTLYVSDTENRTLRIRRVVLRDALFEHPPIGLHELAESAERRK